MHHKSDGRLIWARLLLLPFFLLYSITVYEYSKRNSCFKYLLYGRKTLHIANSNVKLIIANLVNPSTGNSTILSGIRIVQYTIHLHTIIIRELQVLHDQMTLSAAASDFPAGWQ